MAISWALELDFRPRISTGRRAFLLARRNPLGVAGALIILALAMIAIFAPAVAPYDPSAQDASIFLRPNADHWFGTDRFGRDVFSRVVFGTRISLGVGVVSVGLGTTVAALIGIV